ncbi:SubName: Full=Uncharacterized protein {ECO:0000313/EMBL:CCA73949.1} [Serendipita indica DSM 11827]|uniref:Mediator of RNA polymerase II transcription subunit 17 n=1 Tax=Serendipita indica (strain DSM 11827) TaxID=1109443 RepID=G4TRK6_SERID|nr:SubName: Full=Uncharacterized protein {ECO:0000313/EMBL:CCA73949.1} [Serendipita indica DSM 11827]CCA73949.1 hypothetical protein PIIN_07903 [Serendipita indica DSM 11827]
MSTENKEWSRTKLSLEKPYKDANGSLIRNLLDISNEEEFIYEQPKSIDEQLGTRLQRVFDERGNTIWDEYTPQWLEDDSNAPEADDDTEEGEDEDEEESEEKQVKTKKKPMKVEELAKLRSEVVPMLMQVVRNPPQALNELMISRDALGVYLQSASPNAPTEGITPELNTLPPKAIASTIITKNPPLPSIQAFNAQLAVGGKDEALRKSAAAFKTAALSMRRALASGERYWTDALRARNANWPIIAAPLIYNRMTRRSGDTNTMDVCISHGLENSPRDLHSSLVWLNTEDGVGPIAQGNRKPSRLCVLVETQSPDGTKVISRSTVVPQLVDKEDETVEQVLEDMQRESIDREIFAELVANAPHLKTATAWVREQTVSVEISPKTSLRFEIAAEADLEPSPLSGSDPVVNAICDAIYYALRLVLLRLHAYNVAQRRSQNRQPGLPRPPLLDGVVELFLYHTFVSSLERHLRMFVRGLEQSGIEVFLRFNRLGETADELVSLLAAPYTTEDQIRKKTIGGEILLRLAGRQTLRFTMISPSQLTAYLAQSTFLIHSISQLEEVLRHEVNRCVLVGICDIGREKMTGAAKESWFMDVVEAKCFASWDGTNMCVSGIAIVVS